MYRSWGAFTLQTAPHRILLVAIMRSPLQGGPRCSHFGAHPSAIAAFMLHCVFTQTKLMPRLQLDLPKQCKCENTLNCASPQHFCYRNKFGSLVSVLVPLLTSPCPQPGSVVAAPLAEEGHEEGVQTHSQVAVCGAGVGLFLGCVYKEK